MSAVEVPPCFMEINDNPMEIYVQVTRKIKKENCDSENFDSDSQYIKNENYIEAKENGKQNTKSVFRDKEYNLVSEEIKGQENETETAEPLTDDSCKHKTWNQESSDAFGVEDDDDYISNEVEFNEKNEKSQACDSLNNEVNNISYESKDNLDYPLNAETDDISERGRLLKENQEVKSKDYDGKHFRDKNANENQETEIPDTKVNVLPASHVDENDRCKILDSLRAEFVNKIWDDYVSDFLIGSGHVTQAAILDSHTGLILAGSFDFNVHESEFRQILLGIEFAEAAYKYGVLVNGCHYNVKLADGRHGIFAKSKLGGCSVCKTNTLVIIGVHDNMCDPKRCNEEVMRLGDFFVSKGM